MAVDRDKLTIGRLGERLAAEFLKKQGAKVIDYNFHTRFGELDLIAQLGDELLFCEVKTRSSLEYGFPELAVNQSKLDHLTKAVEIYLAEKQWVGFWRLDTLAVQLDSAKRSAKVKWFKDISRNI
ncbi:MAG TPA: YraN family protein [bacterium]|nr:YraN family protein [bacterium]HNS34451.1 YraN family protein [bacterium]HNZ73330.1 YraN family protein [bacterium]HOH67650.1 YraN family protein [bacterium]